MKHFVINNDEESRNYSCGVLPSHEKDSSLYISCYEIPVSPAVWLGTWYVFEREEHASAHGKCLLANQDRPGYSGTSGYNALMHMLKKKNHYCIYMTISEFEANDRKNIFAIKKKQKTLCLQSLFFTVNLWFLTDLPVHGQLEKYRIVM